MGQTLLLDGDVAAYKIASAVEKGIKWEDDLWTLHADEAEARDALVEFIDAALNETGCEDVAVALSDRRNFRYDLYPDYKANRADKRKPLVLGAMREFLKENYVVALWPHMEADDVIGILATASPGKYVIASIDKDFMSIPGTHFDLNHRRTFKVSEPEADWFHMYQTLVGDRVDNYPGCPGMGEIKAQRVLTDCADLWATVVDCYRKAKLTEEDALLQARLARICRVSEWDFENQKVKLWEPKR